MTGRRAQTRALALVAGSPRVARRRAAADRGLVVAHLALVAVIAFLALAGPRVLVAAADSGARAAVRDAGARTDLVATVDAGFGGAGGAPTRNDHAAASLSNAATAMSAQLPGLVASTTGDPTASVSSGRLTVDGRGRTVVGRLAWPWREGGIAVRWVDGGAPGASIVPDQDPTAGAEPSVHAIEVGLTQASADLLGVSVGDVLTATGPTRGVVQLVVSGIYAPVDTSDPLWSTVPGLLGPSALPTAAGEIPALGMLLSDDSLPDVALALQPSAYSSALRFPVRTDGLTSAETEPLAAQVTALVSNPTVLTGAGQMVPTISTDLDAVLRDYTWRLRAATAQASVLLFGLVSVGTLALLLAARLVVARRETLLAAERARGASVASVALRLALESVPLALVGFGLGMLGAWFLSPQVPWTWWPGVAVAVVAALAVPVAGATVAARSWTGQRVPANRRDRERAHRRRQARRTVVELAVVALAVGATTSVRGRGLLQTQTTGIDLLLAATPALVAGAATIALLHLLPVVLRLVGLSAARRRGLVPLLASARATRTSGIGLPLLSLTIAVGLVVFCGVTASSTLQGLDRASDEIVGADVRGDGPIPAGVVADLLARPGVTAAATAERVTDRTFNFGSGVKVTLLAVDAARYDRIAAEHNPRYRGEIARLAQAAGAAGPRALVSPALMPDVQSLGSSVSYRGALVPVDVVGTTRLGGPGELLVVADRDALLAALPPEATTGTAAGADGTAATGQDSGDGGTEAVADDPSILWVDGPGASAAVAAAMADGSLPDVTVTERAAWLDHQRSSPLVASILALLAVSALVLAGLACVALVLTVVATAPERGRTLSALRTLGLDGRSARRITLGELTPLAVAAALAGTAIGMGLPELLTGALGLQHLTGEAQATPVALTVTPVALAVGATALALLASVAVEAAVRRRDRLGDVLRVGER